MGPQWWKMGRELMEKEPVFYKAVQECDDYFKIISGWSILEELQKYSDIKEPELDEEIKDNIKFYHDKLSSEN